MFSITLDKVSKLGDYDETYKQRYWCESPDEDKPLSFNVDADLEITEATPQIHITAEERVEKQSKKGTLYFQLKKVKVSGSQGSSGFPETPTLATKGSESPQSAAVLSTGVNIITVVSQLDRIEKKVNEIHNRLFNNGEELPY